MNPFYLDLWQEELYDWERLKSKRIIDSLLKGIEMGDVFEPVFVWKIAHWDTNYCLDKEKIDPLHPEWRDGGHHRAFAHYLARKPLLVVVSKKFSHVPLGLFSIREIKFDDNVENPFSSCFGIPCLDIEGKLRKDQRYRQ